MMTRRFGAPVNPRSGRANSTAPVQAFQIASAKASSEVTHPSLVVRALSPTKATTSRRAVRRMHPKGPPYRMDDLWAPNAHRMTRSRQSGLARRPLIFQRVVGKVGRVLVWILVVVGILVGAERRAERLWWSTGPEVLENFDLCHTGTHRKPHADGLSPRIPRPCQDCRCVPRGEANQIGVGDRSFLRAEALSSRAGTS